jgi:hypothetical protein
MGTSGDIKESMLVYPNPLQRDLVRQVICYSRNILHDPEARLFDCNHAEKPLDKPQAIENVRSAAFGC